MNAEREAEDRLRTYMVGKIDQINAAWKEGDGAALSAIFSGIEAEGHEEVGKGLQGAMVAGMLRSVADDLDPFRPCGHSPITPEDKLCRAGAQLSEVLETLDMELEGAASTDERVALMDLEAAVRAAVAAAKRGIGR